MVNARDLAAIRVRRAARAGALLVAALALVALIGPLLAPYSPTARVTAPFATPSWAHPLGANDLGQDLLSQLLVSARSSLALGLLAAVAATVIGVVAGLSATLLGGLADAALMRIVDVSMALPMLPLLILLGAFVGTGRGMIVLVIALVMWARVSRVVRAQALSTRTRAYVQAARAMGGTRFYTLRRHLVPAVFPVIVPQFVRAAGSAIILDASIEFLGLGNPTVMSWGTMLYYANARNALLTDAWLWWIVPPGLSIGAAVLALGLVGYGLEERFRPRLRHDWRPGVRPLETTGEGATTAGGEAPASALHLERLTVRYGSAEGPHAVDEASIAVERGEIVGLVGESGCGKTSLVLAAIGLLKPPARMVAARAWLNGHDLGRAGRDERRRLLGAEVALVPQSAMSALNPVQRVVDQLVETLAVHSPGEAATLRTRATALLDEVGLSPDRASAFPHELSGGMRQRVVIAMALAHRPALLIADEPTTGLDVVTAGHLSDLFADLHRRFGMGMLIVSHDLGFVAGLATRLVVMQRGAVVESGPTREMVERPRHAYTRRLLAAVPAWPPASPDGTAPVADRSLERHTQAVLEPLLSFTDVGKAYGTRQGRVVALDGVTFSVGPGETVGLVGASGAGKSTIARLAFDLESPDAGAVRWSEDTPDADARATRHLARRRMHMVFQDAYDALAPSLCVRDLVAEPLVIARLARSEQPARVRRALDAVSLEPDRVLDRFAHELSGGERQRVAFARAIVLETRLIVADEPTSQLDASVKAELVDLMRRLHADRGLAFLFITHDLALAATFCDRLLVMADGRIVEEGPSADVVTNPTHPATAALVTAASKSALALARR